MKFFQFRNNIESNLVTDTFVSIELLYLLQMDCNTFIKFMGTFFFVFLPLLTILPLNGVS